ncbi:MAG: type II toxin-antitoxin system RelE/ParE family toxin [Deltaproteobacteria bacterium]|nr:type II toxin-antitoxin system RelE/ParE family toxin [Deltaproteobacteria bacterium]
MKSPIKLLIEKLADNPLLGKPLRSELAGYYSARFQRWRIIYVIDKPRHAVVIHLIEHRVSVYETLKTLSH